MRHVESEALRNCAACCGAHHDSHFASHTTEPHYQPVFTSAVPCGNSTWLKIVVVTNREGIRSRHNSFPDIKVWLNRYKKEWNRRTQLIIIQVSYHRGFNSDSEETITAVVTVPGGEIPNPTWTSGQGDLTLDQDPNGQCPFNTRGKRESLGQAKDSGVQPQALHRDGLQGSFPRESGHGSAAHNPVGTDLGLSTVCWEEIRRRLESLVITNQSRDEPGTTGNIWVKQEPQSDPVSPVSDTQAAGKDEPDDEPYWQLDPTTDRFRHWDIEDGEWVYYPEEFD
jgi:hypothetical protein